MKYTSLENLSWESDTEARSADPDDVIGTVTDLRVEGDRLLFSVVFGSHDLADRCFRVVEKRINACSISFNPIRQHAEGDAVIIDEAELIEISLGAIAMCDSSGRAVCRCVALLQQHRVSGRSSQVGKPKPDR